MLEIYLNRLAVWKPIGVDGISVRPSPSGVSYLTKDSLVYKQSDGPLYRYAKNYEVGKGKNKIKFSVFLRTDRTDDQIEAEIDEIAKTIPQDYIEKAINDATSTNFIYTDHYIKDKEVL
jgi:hypothetical protein